MDTLDEKMEAARSSVHVGDNIVEQTNQIIRRDEVGEIQSQLQFESVAEDVAISKVEHPDQELVEAVLTQKSIPVQQLVGTAVTNEYEKSKQVFSTAAEVALEATDKQLDIAQNLPETYISTPPSTGGTPSSPCTPRSQVDNLSHIECLAQIERQRQNYEQQLEQLQTALVQKDNMITLYQRENAILDKEKNAVTINIPKLFSHFKKLVHYSFEKKKNSQIRKKNRR